jgi:hypothetical protein
MPNFLNVSLDGKVGRSASLSPRKRRYISEKIAATESASQYQTFIILYGLEIGEAQDVVSLLEGVKSVPALFTEAQRAESKKAAQTQHGFKKSLR